MPRRIAAGLISTAVVGGVGATGALAGWSMGWLKPARDRASQWTASERGRSPLGWLGSKPGRAVQTTGLAAISIWARNLRLPGARLLGLRQVELPAGDPVTVKQALIRDLAARLEQECLSRPIAPIKRREEAKLAAIQSDLKELRHRHHDEGAYNEAVQKLYSEHKFNPLRIWALHLAATAAAQLPRLLSRRHQSLPDRLAGIVVIVEPPARPGNR